MDWQPIETAPKDGTPILAYMPHELDRVYCTRIWICWWNNEKYSMGWETECGEEDGHPDEGYCVISSMVSPTHWMPLPEPPDTP